MVLVAFFLWQQLSSDALSSTFLNSGKILTHATLELQRTRHYDYGKGTARNWASEASPTQGCSTKISRDWASEGNPTLGCSIEISGDI